ncbi:hypothetical protein T10_5427, partial [Trichinella papuae]
LTDLHKLYSQYKVKRCITLFQNVQACLLMHVKVFHLIYFVMTLPNTLKIDCYKS